MKRKVGDIFVNGYNTNIMRMFKANHDLQPCIDQYACAHICGYLTKNEVDRSNLSRFNRSFQVFKNMRGTSMYYEESNKNLMALLRQNGCPSAFLTLSCAEFERNC